MTIFVTGVAGFIGSVVAEHLLANDHKVVGIDNFQESSPESVLTGIEFIEGDYGNRDLLDKIFSGYAIKCVFHFAAETTIESSMTNPAIYFKNNVVNGINLLDSMLDYKIKKIVFSSTAAVYGEPKYIPIDENHDKLPVNAYGASKLMFENILDWYHCAYGMKYNLFRYFNAAGAGIACGENRRNESHLIPLIFRSILDDNFVLNVYGNDYDTKDGTCIRDYVHVNDIANAHILGLTNIEKTPNGRYNLGSSLGYSILEVINVVEKVTGKKAKWIFQNRRIGDPVKLVASNSLALNELRWEIKDSDLETIVRDAFNWYCKSIDYK